MPVGYCEGVPPTCWCCWEGDVGEPVIILVTRTSREKKKKLTSRRTASWDIQGGNGGVGRVGRCSSTRRGALRTACGGSATTTLITSTWTTTMGGSVVSMVLIVFVFLDTRGSAAYGEAARDVCGRRRARHVHWVARAAADRGADGDGGRNGAVGGVETGLDKVFALRLCDKGL